MLLLINGEELRARELELAPRHTSFAMVSDGYGRRNRRRFVRNNTTRIRLSTYGGREQILQSKRNLVVGLP
jgi:hypothetical protein